MQSGSDVSPKVAPTRLPMRKTKTRCPNFKGCGITPSALFYFSSLDTVGGLLLRERGLFLRDAKKMGTRMGERSIRVAVKDAATTRRITPILGEVIHASADGR